MRPWAAARPLAVRAASCARRVGSKPGQALPPPTGTAAWPLKPLRRPPHQWGRVADVWLGASSRSLARPCRRLRAPRPGPAFCSSPVPSGPSGALHTSGAWCAGVWLGALSRCPARPCRRLRAPRPGPAFCSSPVPSGPSGALHTSGAWCAGVWLGALSRCPARPCRSLWASRGSRVLSFWGALVCVVTNVVNPRCFSCGFLIRCYKRRQSEGFFAENGGFWA